MPDYFIDSNNNRFKIVVDQLGSVRLAVNAQTGEVKEKMNHDEFGKVLQDTNPNYIPFGFAGGIYDSETKLVRFGVRDYDARIGRWTSKDPIRFDGGDSNLYGYVLQDSVNLIDPNGKWPEWLDKGVCSITGKCDTGVPDSADWSDTLREIVEDISKPSPPKPEPAPEDGPKNKLTCPLFH